MFILYFTTTESANVSLSHRGSNGCVGVLDAEPVDEGVDEGDDEHDNLDDNGEDDEGGEDKSEGSNHHQDDVVQDLCACMAVLVVDVDHGNQKE